MLTGKCRSPGQTEDDERAWAECDPAHRRNLHPGQGKAGTTHSFVGLRSGAPDFATTCGDPGHAPLVLAPGAMLQKRTRRACFRVSHVRREGPGSALRDGRVHAGSGTSTSKGRLISFRITGSARRNTSAPRQQTTPPHSSVTAAPMRSASTPPNRLPNGAMPA
jgi:hypothetical protein